MDSDEAPPPPYSRVDPLLAQDNNSNAAAAAEVNRVLLRLRGGEAALGGTPSSPSSSSVGGDPLSSSAVPAHFISAAGYFVERPPPTSSQEGQIVDHCVAIYPRSQAKDFPRRPRCWNSRTQDITQQDWDVFLRHLFPPQLGLASTSNQLPRQLRAEIQRDRKDRPQETDDERKRRVAAVIMEWNQYFFEPRSARVMYVYVLDPQNAPRSSLCPRCYPAATKATRETRENRVAPASDAGRGRSQPSPSTVPPAAEPHAPPANPVPAPVPYAYPAYPAPPTPYAPYGPPAVYNPTVYPAHVYPYPTQQPPPPPAPYPQPPPWGWSAPPYGTPYQDTSTTKGGPLGWIASLASQAQKYGERFTEQAQLYGDQISAQAQHYGRQVEEQAFGHSRWIEEQASYQGRKMEDAFTGFVNPSRDDWIANQLPKPGYPQTTPVYASAAATPPTVTPQRAMTAPSERPRRASMDSEASDLSFSSIDSLSTTSDLSASDLTTVRAQLLSLNDHHDRELYEAAVGLRRQLDLVQQSRRQSRASGRSGWRHGWRRWESPHEQHQKETDKRIVKEETRATRKAFRDVLRRAREEQREKRRLKRSRRRQEQRARQMQGATEVPLEHHMQRLELDTHRESQSTVQSFTSIPSPARSLAESEISEISSISTPSTKSSRGGEKMAGKGEKSEKGEKSGLEKPSKDSEKDPRGPRRN
ncbi:uncharacterized protein BO80DRAFT_383588 [Aspergillus ibericus CBS 121593]|uniref:Uncharacterized protein n=1 Tax=Aspergillus ibericus CBS 121593 TaxID=1448316 RepID=A0A395GXH7_9EURO|nr:hypothetical protein BO80DRAFT_383588 [Aspergillus ibericus CBS 121593]RAL00312.1 hypothetical protein BO80DRAFT_383588 [Aspergillus ibericus CBS 121593]